jgi:hypothetical protein
MTTKPNCRQWLAGGRDGRARDHLIGEGINLNDDFTEILDLRPG